ncbi:hypothetical protein, partial [Xenorhabdus bovienii]|uniref:hypothetical protein n=1 Tax=Xenorhabdus bovienii TaxID=40576 RepID=UPI0023B251D0
MSSNHQLVFNVLKQYIREYSLGRVKSLEITGYREFNSTLPDLVVSRLLNNTPSISKGRSTICNIINELGFFCNNWKSYRYALDQHNVDITLFSYENAILSRIIGPTRDFSHLVRDRDIVRDIERINQQNQPPLGITQTQHPNMSIDNQQPSTSGLNYPQPPQMSGQMMPPAIPEASRHPALHAALFGDSPSPSRSPQPSTSSIQQNSLPQVGGPMRNPRQRQHVNTEHDPY